jgi:hypothetical protein
VTDWKPIRIINAIPEYAQEGATQVSVGVILDRPAPPPWHKQLERNFHGTTKAAVMKSSQANHIRLDATTDLLEDAMASLTDAIETTNVWYLADLAETEAKDRATAEQAARDQAFTDELKRRLDATWQHEG